MAKRQFLLPILHWTSIFVIYIILCLFDQTEPLENQSHSTTENETHTTVAGSILRDFPLTNNVEYGNHEIKSYEEPTRRKFPETAVISAWKLTDYRVLYVEDLLQNNIGATFYDARITNYTQFVFLPKQLAIFAVGNTATIMKLDMTSFILMDSFTLPQPKEPNAVCHDSWSCKEATEISLLAMMPNEHMVWFCYVHHVQYLNRPPQHVESRCMVPQVSNLAEPLVQWENPHFNSLDPRQSASILNSADGFTYISAFAPDYVRIFRAHMPDWNGQVNWTGALVTDKSRVFISEPATVLLTFETENEVYFVLREESAVAKTICTGTCNDEGRSTMSEGSVSDVARLVRICKGDRGGLPHVSAENFGTFAKSDLECQAADKDGNHYKYTHISKAYWDNSTQRLYAVFTTEKWAPMGSALCVYTKSNIQASFDGPLLESNAVNLAQPPPPVSNSFTNICQRFNSKNLTMEELDFGRRLSLRYPNRYKPIQPIYKRALFVQTGILWIHLQVYDLPPLPTYYHFGTPARTTIIWLGSKRSLDKIAVYEPHEIEQVEDQSFLLPVICKLNEVQLGRSLNLLKPPHDRNYEQQQLEDNSKRSRRLPKRRRTAKELYLKFWRLNSRNNDSQGSDVQVEEIREVKVLFPRLFIITDRQILWLPLTDCSRYTGFEECLESKDPHCGWSWRDGNCVNGYDEQNTQTANWFNTFSPSIDRRRVENTQCPLEKPPRNLKDTAWSPWYRCRWLDVEPTSPKSLGDPGTTVHAFSRALGYCQCRVCLSHSECILGTQEVINCTSSNRNWLDWSVWSPCDLKTGVQTRERKCRANTVCVGSSREQRVCSDASVWSTQFRDKKISDKLSSYPRTQVKHASGIANWNGSSFGVIHLILIAICCLLLGIFITMFAFCCSRRFGNTGNYMSCNIKQSDNPSSPFFRQHSRRMNKEPNTVPNCWNAVETEHGEWTEKPLEPCLDSTDNESRYQTLLEKTPIKSRLDHKQPCFSRVFASSQQQLLSSSPVPSPFSIQSNPSTASTFVRDKFTFEHLSEQTYDPTDDGKHLSNAKTPLIQGRPILNLSHKKASNPSFNQYFPETGTRSSTETPFVDSSIETKTPQCRRISPCFNNQSDLLEPKP